VRCPKCRSTPIKERSERTAVDQRIATFADGGGDERPHSGSGSVEEARAEGAPGRVRMDHGTQRADRGRETPADQFGGAAEAAGGRAGSARRHVTRGPGGPVPRLISVTNYRPATTWTKHQVDEILGVALE
jgi:hypothetical protein